MPVIQLSPSEKIQRAKIQLLKTDPFYGTLVMCLRFVEESDASVCPTMSISNNDVVRYNPEFVGTLTGKELKSVLVHEVWHPILKHHERSENYLRRIGKFEKFNWKMANIAQDIVLNAVHAKNADFTLPEGALTVSEDKCVLKLNGKEVVIDQVSKKTWEDIYNELRENLTEEGGSGAGVDGWAGNDMLFPEEKEKEGQGEGEGQGSSGTLKSEEMDERWKGALARAAAVARQRGLLPSNMEEFVHDLLEPKIPWASRLRRHITNMLPYDSTWARPSRRSMAMGMYLPSIKKENLEVVVHIDTSGSVWEKTEEFLSEVQQILNAHAQVKLTLIWCDAEIQAVEELGRADRFSSKWMKKLGGGGTSHKPVIDWLNATGTQTRLFISFTDGYSDIQQVYPMLTKTMTKILVFPEENKDMAEALKDHGECIVMFS